MMMMMIPETWQKIRLRVMCLPVVSLSQLFVINKDRPLLMDSSGTLDPSSRCH